MRIKLTHRLSFRFPEAARSLTYVLRLTPRSHDGQRVMRWRIDVEPDCRLKAAEDHLGNLTHTLTIPGPSADPRITVSGELATFDVSGVVRGSAERLPVEIFLRETPLTTADATLQDFAETATRESGDRIGKLHALMGAVHQTLESDADLATPTTAADAFAARRGSAQDTTHVFLACARHLGWPARCVTGYYVPHSGDSSIRHWWAEVLVEGLGWVAFDPTLDICPQDLHIRTAIGLDGIEASGLRGTRLDTLGETVEASWRLDRAASGSTPARIGSEAPADGSADRL